MFELSVHPDARPWTPAPPALAKLRSYFRGSHMKVHLWPRSMANQVLGRHAERNAFRGFTRGVDSHLFVDATETPDSIAWLMAHELCHQMVYQSPTMRTALNEAEPLNTDPAGDAFHDLDPEERFCDGIATRLLGYRQDRAWWRKRAPRVESMGALGTPLRGCRL